MLRSAACLTLVGVFGFGLAGCGGAEADSGVSVTGSVTKAGAGQAGVTVGFVTQSTQKDGPSSRSALTDANGKFEAKLYPGSYKVILSKKVDSAGNPPAADADIGQLEADGQLKESMPPQYTDPLGTPLSAEVPEKGGELAPFVVEG